jgi:hypothetical protein
MLAALFRPTAFVIHHVAHPLLALAILAIMGIIFITAVAAAVTFVILHYGRK